MNDVVNILIEEFNESVNINIEETSNDVNLVISDVSEEINIVIEDIGIKGNDGLSAGEAQDIRDRLTNIESVVPHPWKLTQW